MFGSCFRTLAIILVSVVVLNRVCCICDYLGTDDLAKRLKELFKLVIIQIIAKVLDVDVVELPQLVSQKQQSLLAWDEATDKAVEADKDMTMGHIL